MTPDDLERLRQQAETAGKVCTVGRTHSKRSSQVFVQKRSLERKLFTDCWDIVGGHVEAGETLREALAREVEEETGWQFTGLGPLLDTLEWEAEGTGRLEFDFLVEVEGDLEYPELEETKVCEYRWLGKGELEVLKKNRPVEDLAVFPIVQRVLTFTFQA